MGADVPRNGPGYLSASVIALLFISSLFLLSPDFTQQASALTPQFSRPNVRIDQGLGPVESFSYAGPAVAVDSSGVIHAVWSDDRGGLMGIYYARSLDGGQTWVAEARIDGQSAVNNNGPSIAIDKSLGPHSGNIYVAWQQGDGIQSDIAAIRSTDGGNSWSSYSRVDTAPANVGSYFPHVVVDSQGRIFLTFQDDRTGDFNIYVAKSDTGGVGWFPDLRMSGSSASDIRPTLTTGSGLVCLAWQESAPTQTRLWVSCTSDGGAIWQTNVIVAYPSGTGSALALSIAVDDSRTIHSSWAKLDQIGETSIVYSRSSDNGLTWSTQVQVNDVPPSSTYFPNSMTIVHSASVLYVVWADNRNGDYDIFASWSEDNGATWGNGVMDNNDLRVDDTDDNADIGDETSDQAAPYAAPSRMGIYVVWADNRMTGFHHTYFASFEFSELVITEIRDSPEGFEQVEIFNHGFRDIDVSGWVLNVDGAPISLTTLGTIPASSYRTIGEPAASNIQVNINLRDEGGWVMIVDSVGSPRDVVKFGQLGPPPDPLEFESIERIYSGYAYTDMWSRAPVPTFGARNTGRPPISNPRIVLNEVLFNSANQNDRFIELYFREQGSFDLAGYGLVGDSNITLPQVRLTDTDPYYVIHATQASTLFSRMDATGDNLYLYDPGGSLVDMVGWDSQHTTDMSMSRVPSGFGTSDGYNDTSSIAAGWQFDQIPSIPFVIIGPRQSKSGNFGDTIYYSLTVLNKEPWDAIVNIQTQRGTMGWSSVIFEADGVTPLTDSPGDTDNIPDVGPLPQGASADIQVSVEIPLIPQFWDFEVTGVNAWIEADPRAKDATSVTTMLLPYEFPSANVNPSPIWVDSSPPGCQPKQTVLTLNVTGRGTPNSTAIPQNTVLMIDSSGSMAGNDPNRLRLAAAKHYIDLLRYPDMVAVVDFDSVATLVNGDHLSSDYSRMKSNIDLIDANGWTNLLAPITVATNELLTYGNPLHKWYEIMLTDGQDTSGNSDAQILAEARRAANNGIVIFTIGLGNGVNEVLLRGIATATGGMYIKAEKAEDLDAIYQLIGQVIKSLAGYDDNLNDDIPMINVFLPWYINYVPGTASPVPDYVGTFNRMTNLQWNLSELKINETWTANLKITSSIDGANLRALTYPDSKVTYIRHDDKRVSIPFPITLVDVLAAPTPPDLTVSPSDIVFSVPPPYTEGDSVQISATVHNIGGSASGATIARFHDGMPPSPQIGQDRSLWIIPPGGSEMVSVTWTSLPVGTHDVCVVVDPNNMVAESDETNNLACTAIVVEAAPILKPDYVPTRADPDTSKRIGLSSTVTLYLKVMNQGNATASGDSTIAFFNESSTPFHLESVPLLPPASMSNAFTATWTAPGVEGTYRISAKVDYSDDLDEWDEDNNVYTWSIEVVKGPMTSLVVGSPRHTASIIYVTSHTPLDLDALDQSGSGILRSMYSIDGGAWSNYSSGGTFTLTREGQHYVEWFSEDFVGNSEEVRGMTIYVDDTPPTSTLGIGDPRVVKDKTYIRSKTPLTLTADDGGLTPVGLDTVMYSVDGGSWNADPSQIFLGGEGIHVIEFTSRDLLGNAEAMQVVTLVVDDTPPITQFDIGHPRYLVGANFITSTTQNELSSQDRAPYPVGLHFTTYRVWDGEWSSWMTYHASFNLEGEDGVRFIEYYSIDLLRNVETTRNTTVTLDNTPPSMQLRPREPTVSLETFFVLSADDGLGSGVATFEYRVDDGNWTSYSAPFSLPEGLHRIGYRSADNLDNSAESIHEVVVISDGAPPIVVEFNYKPIVALVFSIILALTGILSAKRRPLNRWDQSKRRLLQSWAMLAMPFIAIEAATGFLSLVIEALRIPPIIGWGTGVDCLILIAGLLYLSLRLLRKKTEVDMTEFEDV